MVRLVTSPSDFYHGMSQTNDDATRVCRVCRGRIGGAPAAGVAPSAGISLHEVRPVSPWPSLALPRIQPGNLGPECVSSGTRACKTCSSAVCTAPHRSSGWRCRGQLLREQASLGRGCARVRGALGPQRLGASQMRRWPLARARGRLPPEQQTAASSNL